MFLRRLRFRAVRLALIGTFLLAPSLASQTRSDPASDPEQEIQAGRPRVLTASGNPVLTNRISGCISRIPYPERTLSRTPS
jgi:hypothetical protein